MIFPSSLIHRSTLALSFAVFGSVNCFAGKDRTLGPENRSPTLSKRQTSFINLTYEGFHRAGHGTFLGVSSNLTAITLAQCSV